MTHQIVELIDLPALQGLMESLHRATGIKHALIDNEGQVLTAVGWEAVCTDFHRVNPVSCARCLESDRHIRDHLHDGPYVGYRCPNGLYDYATPVVIDGEHVGNVFTGQMFHSPPDLDFFRRQAAEFGFDEAAYLAAVRQVEIVPRESMPDIMAFLTGLAQMLGQQGVTRLRQVEAEKSLRRLNENLAERLREGTEALRQRNRELSSIIVRHEQAEAALRQEKLFSDDIINSMPGVFYLLDQQGRLTRWNQKLSDVTGYRSDELGRMEALDLFDPDTARLVAARIAEAFAGSESEMEAPLRVKDGSLIPYYFSGRRTCIAGRPYLVGLGIDIMARKRLEEELTRQAHEDALTGMANRRYFLELAEGELARCRRYGSTFSLLMIDIDQFKGINDRYGHSLGDRLLQAFAEACRKTLRTVDIIGRLGGDEFAAILPETGRAEVGEAAQRLRQAVAEMAVPALDGSLVRCTVSIGAATLGEEGGGIDFLVRQADAALYRAKAAGRNQVALG